MDKIYTLILVSMDLWWILYFLILYVLCFVFHWLYWFCIFCILIIQSFGCSTVIDVDLSWFNVNYQVMTQVSRQARLVSSHQFLVETDTIRQLHRQPQQLSHHPHGLNVVVLFWLISMIPLSRPELPTSLLQGWHLHCHCWHPKWLRHCCLISVWPPSRCIPWMHIKSDWWAAMLLTVLCPTHTLLVCFISAAIFTCCL